MRRTAESLQLLVVETVQRWSKEHDRSQQAADFRLGASDIGVCREQTRLTILQTERREEERVPWAAALGTAVGAWLEAEMERQWGTLTQAEVVATLPSGRTVPGHIDCYEPMETVARDRLADDEPVTAVVSPGAVWDFKAKDGVRLAARENPDRGHVYQIALYHRGLVQAGLIAPDAPAFIVYVDRSGKSAEPVVKEVVVDDALIEEIDAWIEDSIYAVRNGETAPRDRAYEWCQVACPVFWACRGADEHHASGRLIEDEEALSAIKGYRAGRDMEKEGKALKEEARDRLNDVDGTTPDGWVLSHTETGEVTVQTFVRPAGRRLNLRPLKGAKRP